MRAHINRGLPFVLAATGLVMPDGSSGKADYDKVEEFLNDASEAMLGEAAARFPRLTTPTIHWVRRTDDLPDHLGRSRGRQRQHRVGGQRGGAGHRVGAVLPPPGDLDDRAWPHCSLRKGDAAPMAYPFGMPTPHGA